MAETIYTLDGQMHVLLGSTTFPELVRSYMGDDVAERVRKLGQDILNRVNDILLRSDTLSCQSYSRRHMERDLEELRNYIFKNI